MNKQQPIRVGDEFKSGDTVWQVFEDMKFGRGYWVVNVPQRNKQAIMNRASLQKMERA